MTWTQLINTQLDSSLLANSFSPSCLGLVKMCYIFGCLEGVWEMSGGCLSDSGYCLRGCDVQETNKHPIRLICISLFLFFHSCFGLVEMCHILGCLRVSGGCLDGVWGVSEASWILPGWYWCQPKWEKFKQCHIIQPRPFLPVASEGLIMPNKPKSKSRDGRGLF